MTTKTALANVKTYTMRELNQNTAHVLDEINDSHKPAIITKHGRFVALVTPLRDVEIEQLVLSHGPIAAELNDRRADDRCEGISPEEVLEQFKNRKSR
ncbi:type II toxin-antitoxin system Phd/YefM family antitoxin [Saccharothrix xinjiangensis]|uniref:Antitoxin n=1 Tax=Saccharothrix xinjiangensis TaxID=204798 RepID=A0ABV9XVT1_9PSEU